MCYGVTLFSKANFTRQFSVFCIIVTNVVLIIVRIIICVEKQNKSPPPPGKKKRCYYLRNLKEFVSIKMIT